MFSEGRGNSTKEISAEGEHSTTEWRSDVKSEARTECAFRNRTESDDGKDVARIRRMGRGQRLKGHMKKQCTGFVKTLSMRLDETQGRFTANKD
jgi:hypothetical protein